MALRYAFAHRSSGVDGPSMLQAARRQAGVANEGGINYAQS